MNYTCEVLGASTPPYFTRFGYQKWISISMDPFSGGVFGFRGCKTPWCWLFPFTRKKWVLKLLPPSHLCGRFFDDKNIYHPQAARNEFLVVEPTHLKNIGQIGSFPKVGVNIENGWNHHLEIHWCRGFLETWIFLANSDLRLFGCLEKAKNYSPNCLEPQTTIYKWMFQLDDSKSWHKKLLFHQTSIYKWLFGVPGGGLIMIYRGKQMKRSP